MNTFNEKDIIDSYRLRELLKAFEDQDKRCDFLERLNNSIKDQKILEHWKDWFTSKNVPWAVTEKKGRYGINPVLWKIDESLTQQEIKASVNRGVYK